jgi:hypothetical protein
MVRPPIVIKHFGFESVSGDSRRPWPALKRTALVTSHPLIQTTDQSGIASERADFFGLTLQRRHFDFEILLNRFQKVAVSILSHGWPKFYCVAPLSAFHR